MLVDLKRRIDGRFRVVEETASRIVLFDEACPSGDKEIERPSMRTMTSTVFGAIAAENPGHARVDLAETIAGGASGSRVVIHLAPGGAEGREHLASEPG